MTNGGAKPTRVEADAAYDKVSRIPSLPAPPFEGIIDDCASMCPPVPLARGVETGPVLLTSSLEIHHG
jgi:hypothetical protein